MVSYIVKSNLLTSQRLPEIYEVTSLCKEQDHHVPRGAFSRMITFIDNDIRRSSRRNKTLVKKDHAEIEK
jgi:hypothetical protein